MRRASVVELVVDKSSEERLKLLCSLSSKLWNEVNYARRRMFFEKRGVDFKATYKEYYEKYKALIGSATAQQILNKNDEAWKSFFKMLKLKKESKLPPFITRVNPPGYKKKNNKRTLWTVLRRDQYRIESDKIVFKGLGAIDWIEIKYKGLIHLKGEQGRLEIHYDQDKKKWYAHISFEVAEKAVRSEWTSIPKQPKNNLVAGIDIGVNNLMAIYVEKGLARLVNGRPLKAISHYWRVRIAEYQSTLNKYGLKTSKRLRSMYSKWRRQIKSYVDSRVRQAIEWLYSAGVSIIKVGYPKYIAQENGNFNNAHVWTYGYLLRKIYEVAEEHGIRVVYVNEAYTSSKCPIHGERCGERIKRGLFKCTKLDKVLNADLVGAYNILITPSPVWDRGNGPEARPGIEPSGRGNVIPNLPALTGTLVLLRRGGGQRAPRMQQRISPHHTLLREDPQYPVRLP
ncbi:MAG: transposase [Fervidicoccaceae archaeon]